MCGGMSDWCYKDATVHDDSQVIGQPHFNKALLGSCWLYISYDRVSRKFKDLLKLRGC